MALPHVRPAAIRTGAPRTTLEAVIVRISRFIDAKQLAQIEKMLLRTGAFRKLIVLLFFDEGFGRHARVF